MNKEITINRFLTGDIINFRRDFYNYLNDFCNERDEGTGKTTFKKSELVMYMMKRFRGSCNPMQLNIEIDNI